jgi:plasmid maintenance system killer protein
MKEITTLGACPKRIINKATQILLRSPKQRGEKRVSGLKSFISIRVNHKYRMLLSERGEVFLGVHDAYEKKIRNLKKELN